MTAAGLEVLAGDALGADDRRVDAEIAGCRDLVAVGRGGDGVVYRGWQEVPGRWVAVKVYEVGRAPVVPGLVHPGVVAEFGRGVLGDGRAYVLMEFCAGGSLHDLLRESGPLPVEVVLDAGIAVADALAYAHGTGVVHGDVTPRNVLVDSGACRLVDFGGSAERFSYRHAAPAVLDGAAPTAADDVYSLGSTLFTVLTGRPPYAGDAGDDSALSYLRRVRSGQRRAFRRNGVPGALVELVNSCLDHDPELRPGAAAARDALAAVPRGLPAWAPRQLPLPPPGAATLSAHLGQIERGDRVVLIAGDGAAGLAVYFGQSTVERFVDGQLYADLEQPDPLPRFLRALGVPAERVPSDVDEREGLYRTALSGRRVLVVLVNAGDPARVRPLLPGAGAAVAVVAGRDAVDVNADRVIRL
jgi:Protein kinase domain